MLPDDNHAHMLELNHSKVEGIVFRSEQNAKRTELQCYASVRIPGLILSSTGRADEKEIPNVRLK